MKTFKNTVLGLSLLTAGLMNAQNPQMTNMFKIGLNGGIAVPTENVKANIGFDFAYQYLITQGFGIGVATGYNHFMANKNTIDGFTIDNNDAGVVPLAALIRIYPKEQGFYFGSDLGYGFIVGDDKVASNVSTLRPDGGFYIKPEIGYHNEDWNFSVQYTKVFTGDTGKIGPQDYNLTGLGLGISYNIPLGK